MFDRQADKALASSPERWAAAIQAAAIGVTTVTFRRPMALRENERRCSTTRLSLLDTCTFSYGAASVYHS